MATYKDEPVGVCALCKMDDPEFDYELAKLAVDPCVRGKGIGVRLCEAAVNKARELGARKIFLESNTLLKPAVHIYKRWDLRSCRSINLLMIEEISRWN